MWKASPKGEAFLLIEIFFEKLAKDINISYIIYHI